MSKVPKSIGKIKGVTLIEAMVTLAVAAVIVSLAAPSFQGVIASSRIRASTSDLVNALAQTRDLAIKEGGRVTMCVSSNGTQCATSGSWEQGWLIFTDPTRVLTDTTANVGAGDVIRVVAQAAAAGIVIKGNGAAAQYVSYSADGTSKQNNGAFLASTIRVCSTSGSLSNSQRARDIAINSVGRVVTTTPANVSVTCPSP